MYVVRKLEFRNIPRCAHQLYNTNNKFSPNSNTKYQIDLILNTIKKQYFLKINVINLTR